MTEIEAGLYKCIIKSVLAFLVVLILAITLCYIVDIAGPVRPKETSIYYWPPQLGLNVPGSNNRFEGR
jgi:uncharacterized membrane protein